MGRKVTSHDVAELAGVSRSAVSLVLNGRADGLISAENQQAVKEAAKQLGYRPNRVARSLRNSSTHTIGVISDAILTGSYGGAIVTGATARAARDDYLLLVMGIDPEDPSGAETVDALLARQVDALVYAAEGMHPWQPPESFIAETNILMNAYDPDGKVSCVNADEVLGGYRATRLLLDAGHRDIIMLTGPADYTATERRVAGFEQAVQEAGITAQRLECGWNIDDGLRLGSQILAADRPPTGIVCANDRVGAGVLLAAARLGLRIPEDLSIVGYDDDPNVARQLNLSTISLPHREIGEQAMDLLLTQLETEQAQPQHLLIEGDVIERGSIAQPRSR